MNWVGWPLSRILLLFTGMVFVMIAIQVTLFHYRQNFRHWAQWVPVIALPILGMISLVVVFFNPEWLNLFYTLLLILGMGAGILGFVLHIRGIGERVDGYQLQNFLIGPPPVLPLMVTAMSLLGILILYWG